MRILPPGLYHALVTESLQRELESLAPDLIARGPLHSAEVADRMALHIARTVERAIAGLPEKDRVTLALKLAKTLIAETALQAHDPEIGSESPLLPGAYLSAIHARHPDGRPREVKQPLIPLIDTALLTNAPDEPRVGSQVLAEIPSSDRIDVIMAFIRRSGIRPLLDELKYHCQSGRALRILTTTYTGSTEGDALDDLARIGADIRLSYDESTTRLHAKAWLFHRDTGCSTAYIGSSNLTHSAQVSGLEWNARFSALRNEAVIAKVTSLFDTYWHSGNFRPYDRKEFDDVTALHAQPKPTAFLPAFEIRLEPFQERMLEQIALSRLRGYHRNLLVSATGTGKTVMAAIDFARLKEQRPNARLLFVVHRKEILHQALATFRLANRDSTFGELWVDGVRPERYEHVFASIQSLHANAIENLDPAHFDIVIVDEFHHAEAPTYRRLLNHLKPVELLGLTATPERPDNLPLLHWFDDRIAAEFRLWDAIDQQTLVPFAYYGVADDTDYTGIPWKRGTGYDVNGVTKLLTANDIWARRIIEEVRRRVDSIETMRALGFCVSVDHARFMARVFSSHGIMSEAVCADTPADARDRALRSLASGDLKVIFSVDLFNEGVDVPTVDTLIMLRPTDSATLFIQQLGRGLRKHRNKRLCTVIDFVGLHRKEFRFDRRLGAILRGTRNDLTEQIKSAFPYLPAGCHMELDSVAMDRVISNIKAALPTTFTNRIGELRAIAKVYGDVSLERFLKETGLDLQDIYDNNRSWSDYREAAGLALKPAGPREKQLRRACGRMLHVDDIVRIDGYRDLLGQDIPLLDANWPTERQRLCRMLVSSLVAKCIDAKASLEVGCDLLRQHPQIMAELDEMLALLAERLQHVPLPLVTPTGTPIQIHATYSRTEIQAAFGDGTHCLPPTWREGVKFLARESTDIFVFTRDKSEKTFSPTTLYNDYAISRDLIHWESQSTTRAESEAGLRYRTHKSRRSHVILFARHSSEERGFFCLGPAEYVSHRGEKPLKVIWRLRHPLPGDIYQSLAAAVA
jgi:superfamily II DNA or RNA helicase/HKD family nuclease